MPEFIGYSTGIDRIRLTVDTAPGLLYSDFLKKPVECYKSYHMLDEILNQIFKAIRMSRRISSKILEKDIYSKAGGNLNKYLGSNETLGRMILGFDTMEGMMNMNDIMDQDNEAIATNEVQSSKFVA